MNNTCITKVFAAITFDEFCEKYFLTGLLFSGKYLKKPAKTLNNRQLKTQYNNHLRKLKRLEYLFENSPSAISKDQIIRQECIKRDRHCCQLMSVLTYAEKQELIGNSIPVLLEKLDCAHVFGKNAYPKMRYVIDNVVLINRISHGWLDVGKSPINGKSIGGDQKQLWWIRIVGKQRYEKLLEISREGQ